MILAAGLGTRLGGLTRSTAKALIPVGGVAMLERVALRLLDAGTDRLIINVHHFAEQIEEFVPGEKVVWHVLDNYFSFTEDRSEWKGTDVVFDISRKGDQTEVRVTHVGLVPEYECYDVCSDGWTTYINGSLKSLIETGKGNPNLGEPMNENERALAV